MKKVYILSEVGCGYRLLDAQRFSNYFSENNFRIVHKPEEADYIIFVTCGISNQKADNCVNIIKEFQKFNAELIVAGCLPSIRPDLIDKNFNGKIIVTKDLIKNPDKMDQFFPENKIKFSDVGDTSIIEIHNERGNWVERSKKKINILLRKNHPVRFRIIFFLMENIPFKIRRLVLENFLGENSVILHYRSNFASRSEYCIRVSWGCRGNCTYCGIKKGVGPFKSKPFEQIITDFKKGLEMGYKDFYIAAPDLGPYGLDIGSNLPELLEEITKIEGDYTIFLGGLNPVWAVKYADSLEKILKKGKIQKMECPIQSGSDRILKLMKRYNNVEKIKETYLRFKKSYPGLLLYPHIMFGFPTETKEDVEKTLAFIKLMNFNSGQVYSCSCIPGTEAAEIEPKVPCKMLLETDKYVKKFLKKEDYALIGTKDFRFFYKKNTKDVKN